MSNFENIYRIFVISSKELIVNRKKRREEDLRLEALDLSFFIKKIENRRKDDFRLFHFYFDIIFAPHLCFI